MIKKIKFLLLVFFFINFVSYSYASNVFIDAKKLNIDLEKQIATYIDDVVVKNNGKILECEEMDVHYNKRDKGVEAQNLSIRDILFHRNIILSDNVRVINADEGIYKADERMVYLWGEVKIKENGSYLEAKKVKYDMKRELLTIINQSSTATKGKKRVRVIIDDTNNKVKSQ